MCVLCLFFWCSLPLLPISPSLHLLASWGIFLFLTCKFCSWQTCFPLADKPYKKDMMFPEEEEKEGKISKPLREEKCCQNHSSFASNVCFGMSVSQCLPCFVREDLHFKWCSVSIYCCSVWFISCTCIAFPSSLAHYLLVSSAVFSCVPTNPCVLVLLVPCWNDEC